MALKAHLDTPSLAIEGRRQSRRALRLETSGALPGGAEANVTVHNISAAGLLIETDLTLGVGEMLALDLPHIGPVGAEIVWQSGDLFGCAFQQALGEAALAAAHLRGDAPSIAPEPREFGSELGKPISDRVTDPLGVRLNRLRREKGLTLAQVAASLGVSKPTVWAWEKGKARPLPERLGAIADVLGVKEADLNQVGQSGQSAELVENCRLRIASAYRVNPNHVRIMIEV